MNAENTCRLIEQFPSLYGGSNLSAGEQSMAFGFSCGDGWFELIYALSQQIHTYNLEHPEAAVIAVQVKQKMGTLRFYVDIFVPEVEDLIEQAVTQSAITCELTGRPGVRCQRRGYLQTLCLEKAQELGFEPVQQDDEQSFR